MYAIIKTGGKQYRVQEGETIFVEKLEAEVDSAVVFDEVLAVGGEGDLKVGTPVVSGAKANYRRRQGHRQPFTKVVIEKIEG